MVGLGRFPDGTKEGILVGLNCFVTVGGELEYFSSPNDEKLKLIPVSSPDRGVIALFSLLLFFLYLDENVFGDRSVGDGLKAFSAGDGLKESTKMQLKILKSDEVTDA